MSAAQKSGADQTPQRVASESRQQQNTAPARCQCYAAFSDLTASLHEVDAPASAAQRLGAAENLPFASGLDALLTEFLASDPAQLRSAYSELFEVGSKGPPASMREDLQTGQKAGTREDIVRFYDYFGYRLEERFAWAPDHLSVELEFMHFLCYHEGRDDSDRLSFQLAQLDFATRHLAQWVPALAQAVSTLAPGSFYSRMLFELQDFITRDLAWQKSTILVTGEGAAHG